MARIIEACLAATPFERCRRHRRRRTLVPTIAQEEYLGAILRWHGVADADMSYVMPNWATWSSGARGPIGLYG